MKTCEVCGRRIRTGRKYCYEHRNTRNDNIVNRATKGYINYHASRSSMIFALFGMMTCLIIFFSISSNAYTCLAIGLIILIISFTITLYISRKYYKIKSRGEAERDVREKNPDYVSWVQTRVNKVKKEREFRKKLWK